MNGSIRNDRARMVMRPGGHTNDRVPARGTEPTQRGARQQVITAADPGDLSLHRSHNSTSPVGPAGRAAELGNPWLGRASENALGVFMYAFVADQILGINGLVNISNIVFLAAYSVRDVLRLRILSIVGELLILPYYYFQNETLWPPIFWGVAFIVVNAVRIVAIALERRPVVLSDKEEQLYGLAFSSIDKREFFCRPAGPMGRLRGRRGHSRKGPADIRRDRPHFRGPRSHSQQQDQGSTSTRSAHWGRERLQRLGQSDGRSGSGPGTLAKWDLRQLREFTASRPELRAKLLQVVSLDLSVKLRHVATAVSDFTAGKITSELPPSGA